MNAKMRNAVAIIVCIALLVVSLTTGLFQTVPFSTDNYFERVFSFENIFVNAVIAVIATALVLGIYVFRRTRRRK